MKCRRGAPIDNQNAFRHGFYSNRFRRQEMDALGQSNALELADEIALMRVATARLLASLESHTEPRDIQTELSILRAINLSALSINGLVRTRLMLTRGNWDLVSDTAELENRASAVPDPVEQPAEATPAV